MPSETFEEKDKRFLAYSSGWAREANQLNNTVDLSTIEDEEIPKERAKQAREREIKFYTWDLTETPKILNWAIGLSSGVISTPIPTFEKFAAKAKTATPQGLRVDIEEVDFTMLRIQEAIKFMRVEFQPDKDPDVFRLEKWEKDECFTIGNKMSTHTFRVEFTIEAFTALQKEIQEKIAILEEACAWHEKVKKIYDDELLQRSKNEPAEVARITAELKRVVKDGELQRNVMAKAVKTCYASKFTDKTSAQSFLNAKRRFHELGGEHHSLLKQLRAANVSDRKLGDLPDFPLQPNPKSIDERSDWQRIERLANLS